MPAEFKTGTATSYDSNLMQGKYTEAVTGTPLIFEVSKPTVNVIPGDLVEILYKTPSGKILNVVIKINGRDV